MFETRIEIDVSLNGVSSKHALPRLAALTHRLLKEFADHGVAQNKKVSSNAIYATFLFKGHKVRGEFFVRERDVRASLTVPMLGYPFRRKIKQMLLERVTETLFPESSHI